MSGDLGGRRILVVEDEVILAWALQDMLAGYGCEVVGPAARISQALDLINRQAVDAAVLDVNLNGQKCYPVADALVTRGVPFVFSTAYSSEGIEKGYRHHSKLQKPFSGPDLAKALSGLLTDRPAEGQQPEPTVTLPPPAWDEAHLRFAAEAAGATLWAWNRDSGAVEMDASGYALWAIPPGPLTFEDLLGRIPAADMDQVRATLTGRTTQNGQGMVEFRIEDDTGTRWLRVQVMDDAAAHDQPEARLLGVFLDVTARRQAEEAREALSAEVAHRVSNLFAVTAALTRISALTNATPAEMAEDLTLRFAALDKAHAMVRPRPGNPAKAALLHDLLEALLAPHANGKKAKARVRIKVPPVMVGEGAAATLALVLHELTANAARHGALSNATGTVEITGTERAGEVVLIWREAGGPVVSPTSPTPGFGSRLLMQSVSNSLGGRITYEWPSTGLVVTLRMPGARLAA